MLNNENWKKRYHESACQRVREVTVYKMCRVPLVTPVYLFSKFPRKVS